MIQKSGIAAAAIILSACGIIEDKDSNKGGSSLPGPKGCIQGFVKNGMTGNPVKVPVFKSEEEGLYVWARNRMLPAIPAVNPEGEDATTKALAGEYLVCDIPLDETFPMFARVNGYQAFVGNIRINSRRNQLSEGNVEKGDLWIWQRSVPTEQANILLFPSGIEAKDLEVFVTHAANPVQNAMVQLVPKPTNTLGSQMHVSGQFLPPSSVRLRTLNGKTNEEGKIVFPGSSLVLGGNYGFRVLPPDGGSEHTFRIEENVTIGLLGARGGEEGAQDTDVYRLEIELQESLRELKLESRSNAYGLSQTSGELVLVFSQNIKLVNGSAEGMDASLSGNVGSELNEQAVKWRIEGSKLFLTPDFRAGRGTAEEEKDLAIRYSGIQVRTEEAPYRTWNSDQAGVDLSVRFYN